MKRISLIILSIVFITSGCQEEQPNIQNNYENQIAGLNDLYAASLSDLQATLKSSLVEGEEGMELNSRTLFISSAKFIDSNYYLDHDFLEKDIAVLADDFQLRNNSMSAARLLETEILENEHFNDEQVSLLQPFFDKVLDAENFLNAPEQIIVEFNDQVINSNLNEEQKFELFSIGSAALNSANFINNGGIDLIATQLEIQGLTNGRVQGCSVNTRNVLAAGVVTGTSVAVKGAIAGATAGTFTVPVLGTATGAVGGAVFGFASGFVSGVVGGVAAELLTSCFR